MSSENIVMDIADLEIPSGGKKKKEKGLVKEETVEELIAKLESKGKRVAVLDPS